MDEKNKYCFECLENIEKRTLSDEEINPKITKKLLIKRIIEIDTLIRDLETERQETQFLLDCMEGENVELLSKHLELQEI